MNTAQKLQLISNDGVQLSMIDELPEPMTPEDCDLSNFPYFPFDAVKFRDSEFAATVDPAAGFYAVMLWSASWHQVSAIMTVIAATDFAFIGYHLRGKR